VSSILRFMINGKVEEASGLDPHTTLLQYLRQRGLTGTKEGCAEGECGACAVVMIDHDFEGPAHYEAVNACLVLLPLVHGRSVWTVEGVANAGTLHPVQTALVEAGGSQCGYCTPGFVMSMFAHYYRSPRDGVDQALGGNLCRCTGYRPIRDATRALPQVAPNDPFAHLLGRQVQPPSTLAYEAHGVSFLRPSSLAEALQMRAEQPDTQVIAGGTDLVVEVNQNRARHSRFLSLVGIPELNSFRVDGDGFVLGAGLTWNELEAKLAGQVPLVAQLVPLFASRLIRARATLGGNLLTASPVGDAAPVLLALDAELELASLRGARRVPISSFFTGYRQTVLAPDELLVCVRIPRELPTVSHFYKVSKRVLDDISCVSAAFALTLDGGVIRKARIAFGGMAATPVRASAAEAALIGQAWDKAALARAQQALRGAFTPLSDVRGSAAYRLALVESLLEKFYLEAQP